MLNAADQKQSIFGNWNENHRVNSPDTSHANFGHWAQKDVESLGDELDFVTNEYQSIS